LGLTAASGLVFGVALGSHSGPRNSEKKAPAEAAAPPVAVGNPVARPAPVAVSIPSTPSDVFDPSLIPAHEDELQKKLQSTNVPPEALARVAEIARKATQGRTRQLALEALADSESAQGQKLMADLFKDPKFDAEGREQILTLLRPQSPDDEAARLLVQEIRNDKNPEANRVQALAPLVVMSLMNRQGGPDPALLGRLPTESRRQFMSMYQAMLTGEEPEGLPEGWAGDHTSD
jgi:hypothetical protein